MSEALTPAPPAPPTPELPAVGQPAPDFELPDDTGRTRRLSDERGRWLVLYFYPKDDTPGCTVEACEFRDTAAQIEEEGAEVWAISILDSASKARFKAKFELPFTLLADEDHRIAEAYGSWILKQQYGRSYWGVRRSTLLIDPDGHVARTWAKVQPEGHAAEVLAALRAEKAARDGAGSGT